MERIFYKMLFVLATVLFVTAAESTMTTAYGTLIEDTAADTMEFLNSIGVKPVGFTQFGTPIADEATINRKLIESRRRCTSGPCCDMTTSLMKTYGSPCTPPEDPCKRVAGFCLGGSAECRMQNKEDGAVCHGTGKCSEGKCIINDCDKDCCDEDKSPLPHGTQCRGGKCDFGKCVPDNVSVVSLDTTTNNFLERQEIPLVIIQTPSQDSSDTNSKVVETQPTTTEALSYFDRKILSRVDRVLDKYNEKKTENLKVVLHGITEKARRRKAELDRVAAQKDKKEKVWQTEVEQAKKEREELEKIDSVNW